MSDLVGQVIEDRWAIESEIGRGGFSVVFAARDTKLDQEVALKLLVPPPASAKVALERLKREVRAVRSLNHPNIVSIYDLIEESSRAFVVMELVHGQDLAAYVADRGPLSDSHVAEVGVQISQALEAAHRNGILHRDVKPQNIILSRDGQARLLDFGSARIEGEASLTRSGGFVGTLDYAAPEIFAGERPDARADIYSLGLALHFAATGELPRRPSNHLPPEALDAGFRPRKLRATLAPWLDDAIARATVRDPRGRFPTVGAFASTLSSQDRALATTTGDWLRLCLLCGSKEPTRGGVCRRCDERPTSGHDALIYITSPQRNARRRVEKLLSGVTGRPPGLLHDVVLGRQALSKVSDVAGTRVVDRLNAAGVPARLVRGLGLVKHIPVGVLVTIFAVACAGVHMATYVDASTGTVGPLLSFLMLGLALRSIQTPLIAGRDHPSPFPDDLESKISTALGSMKSERARGLLADIVELGALVRLEIRDDRVASDVDALVGASIEAGERLGALDDTIRVLTEQKLDSDRVKSVLADAEQAWNGITQQFLEAIATLGRLQTSTVPAAHDALAELNSTLSDSVAFREEAIRDVEAFLADVL